MRVRVPDYFDGFSCLAGACPHSCCIGWEVVLDEDTVRRYQQLPGALGERLRDAMALDGEDVCFPLDGRRCPFLNQENLCDIHCALGPEATSVTCREHPRFIEDYGPFQEITLSAACPKANELLLGTRDPLTFSERQDNQPTEDGDEWLDWLVPLRDRLLDLLRDRSRSLKPVCGTSCSSPGRPNSYLTAKTWRSWPPSARDLGRLLRKPMPVPALGKLPPAGAYRIWKFWNRTGLRC